MTVPWWVEMRGEQLVLELRELLVRVDENLAAHHLMQNCIPYFLDDASHPLIAQARADQAAMVDHIVGDSYAHYYATNHHEKPFEEQYQCSAEEAHERLHRVRFLRRWLEEEIEERKHGAPGKFPVMDSYVSTVTLLDLACNDGWMAKNLEGLALYHGLDLNPHCIERAKSRKVPGARFQVAFAEQAEEETFAIRQPEGYDAVVAYELVEHVKDPAAVLAAMVACCKPGGSLFVSTPLGAGTGGDLPTWWLVEPKGHVRAYTPQSFADLLSPHGVTHIEISDTQGAGQLMVARVQVPEIVESHGTERVRAHRARGKGNPRPARRSRPAER